MNPRKITVKVEADTSDFLEKLAEAQRAMREFEESFERIRRAIGASCPTCGHRPERACLKLLVQAGNDGFCTRESGHAGSCVEVKR